MQLQLTEAPDWTARELIAAGLGAFNTERGGAGDWRRLAVLIRQDDIVTGGLWGATSYGWLFTELLFVPEALRGRGLGAEILGAAEAEARRRGCSGAWLDTFEFQARGFYERLGYQLFGRIDGYPPGGGARFFLKKAF